MAEAQQKISSPNPQRSPFNQLNIAPRGRQNPPEAPMEGLESEEENEESGAPRRISPAEEAVQDIQEEEAELEEENQGQNAEGQGEEGSQGNMLQELLMAQEKAEEERRKKLALEAEGRKNTRDFFFKGWLLKIVGIPLTMLGFPLTSIMGSIMKSIPAIARKRGNGYIKWKGKRMYFGEPTKWEKIKMWASIIATALAAVNIWIYLILFVIIALVLMMEMTDSLL